MKQIAFVCFWIVLLIFPGLVNNEKNVKKVEGLYYLDQSPVSIEIIDGKIGKISRIKELPGEYKNIYIPARLYGLTDRGEAKPGMRADLILFTLDNFKMEIRKTFVAGEVVYESGK